MYDAVDVAAIPKDAQIVAGYVDGNWPTFDSLATAFPDAERVSITVKGKPGARVADCETGDLSPATAAGWARSEIAAGRRPTLYYSKAAAPAVAAALKAENIGLAELDYWVADWTGEPHLVPGSVATQYADPPHSGGNFDVSQTAPGWPVAAPAPEPEPPTPTTEEPSMGSTIKLDDGTVVSYLPANGHWVEVVRKPGSVGQPSTTANTEIIDLTDAWPKELSGAPS